VIRGRFASPAWLLLPALALASGCAKEPQPDNAALKAAIESVNVRFAEAFAHRDVAALGQLYAADAHAFPPGSRPVEGRTAIQDMWKGVLGMPVGRIQRTTVEVGGNGDTAWETGRYALIGTNGGTMDEGEYIVLWKHDANGWKLYRHMWTSNTPQQAADTTQSARP